MSRYEESGVHPFIVRRRPPVITPSRMPRGTRRDLGRSAEEQRAHQTEDLPLGDNWHRTLRLETLGRNLETAGGLEQTWRLGRADIPIEIYAALAARRGLRQ